MPRKISIELGQRVRDKITGFEGIAYGITDWMTGCRHIGVKQTELDKDGKITAIQWLDEPQCQVVKPAAKAKKVAKTGGPRAANPRKS